MDFAATDVYWCGRRHLKNEGRKVSKLSFDFVVQSYSYNIFTVAYIERGFLSADDIFRGKELVKFINDVFPGPLSIVVKSIQLAIEGLSTEQIKEYFQKELDNNTISKN